MRIDYSEPKKAYISPQGGARPRKEPRGMMATAIIVTGVITFVTGFGTGWFLSQKAAKKSFQAAMEQKSLESTSKSEAAPPKPVQPVQPVVATPPQDPQAPQTAQTQTHPAGAAASAPVPAAPATAPDPQLSFYKNLPSGQKSAPLGSGINAKEEQPKVPLQAAIPSNVPKPTVPAPVKSTPAPAKPTSAPPEPAKQAADGKPAKPQEGGFFTVQLASFPLKSEAETLKGKVAAKGYNVYISESNQGEKGIWYRVRVGKKLEQAAAKELAGKLGKGALAIPERD